MTLDLWRSSGWDHWMVGYQLLTQALLPLPLIQLQANYNSGPYNSPTVDHTHAVLQLTMVPCCHSP